MRYFFAILSLAIAAVLLVLGIGQRTFLAPATSVTHDIVATSEESQYIVIPAEVFALEKGNPSVVITGENVFLSLAEMRDIEGWLRPNTYDTVSANVDTGELAVAQQTPEPVTTDDAEEPAETEAEPEQLPDPRGSDLWLSEYSGETSLKVAVSPDSTQGVLVTSGEDFTSPTEMYVIWAQERSTPLAGPLLAAGALFAALGVMLYLFAVDHDRRGLGPRRGRRGPFQGLRNRRSKRGNVKAQGVNSQSRRGARLGYTVAGLAIVGIAVTGCSPSYWPQASSPEPEVVEEQPDSTLAVVPVTDGQIDTILQRIVDVASAGDETLDATLLSERFEGPALAERTANYAVRDAAEGTAPLPHLTTNRLQYNLVQSTEKWPRTMFVTVESSDVIMADEEAVDAEAEAREDDEIVDLPDDEQEQSPTLVLLLKQDSPHDNYQVTATAALRGGIEMPAAAPLDEGTAVLANDIKTLRLAPRDAVDALANILQQGEDGVEEAEVFDIADDPLFEKFGANWPTQNCIEGLKCSQSVTRTDDPVTTLSTGQGGALVVATLSEQHNMEIENERDQVKLSDVEMALGLDGSYSQVTRTWQHNVLMYIPNDGSDERIQILGSSTQVLDASGVRKEGA